MLAKRWWSLASVAALVLVACGDGDGEPTATVAPNDEPTSEASAPAEEVGFGSLIDGAGAWDWTVTSIGQGTKPGIALNVDGAPMIAYLLERVGDAGFVNVASVSDGRVSIETLQRGYLYGPLDIAIGSGGAVVTYHNHDWEDGAVAIQGAAGWDVQRIAHPGHDGWDGSLALDGDGTVHLLSIDPAQFGAPEGIEYATRSEGDWSVEPVGSGPQPYEWGTDLAVAADGTVHAVYFDAGSSDLIYAVRTTAGWDLTPISEDGDAGRFAAIALDTDGTPHVTFIRSDAAIADEGRHAVEVVYGTPGADGWSFESVVDLDNVVTGFEGARRTVALAVGADGPLVAAIDESRLVLARAVDSVWTSETVVTAQGDPLQVVGLALDASGAPHLTFATTTGNGPLDGEVWYLEPSASS